MVQNHWLDFEKSPLKGLKTTHLLGFQPFVASGFEPDVAENMLFIKNLPLKGGLGRGKNAYP